MENFNWVAFRDFAVQKNLSMQCIDDGDRYYLFAIDGAMAIGCNIYKNGSECADFETNFKANTNKEIQNITTTQNEKNDKAIKIACFSHQTDNTGHLEYSFKFGIRSPKNRRIWVCILWPIYKSQSTKSRASY